MEFIFCLEGKVCWIEVELFGYFFCVLILCGSLGDGGRCFGVKVFLYVMWLGLVMCFLLVGFILFIVIMFKYRVLVFC